MLLAISLLDGVVSRLAHDFLLTLETTQLLVQLRVRNIGVKDLNTLLELALLLERLAKTS